MKITTKGRYGMRALIDICLYGGEGRVSLSDISARQDLSVNYLESIFAKLKRGGLVIGAPGAQGGYVLARPADAISLLEILRLLEGDLSLAGAVEEDGTPERRFLRAHVWSVMERQMEEALAGMTLEDMTPCKKARMARREGTAK